MIDEDLIHAIAARTDESEEFYGYVDAEADLVDGNLRAVVEAVIEVLRERGQLTEEN